MSVVSKKDQMQMGRFLVHVYHRRHDVLPAYTVNEEVHRPLVKQVVISFGVLPLKNSGLAVISVSIKQVLSLRCGIRPAPFSVHGGLPAASPGGPCASQIAIVCCAIERLSPFHSFPAGFPAENISDRIGMNINRLFFLYIYIFRPIFVLVKYGFHPSGVP